jgi:hypothetical protein
MTAKATMPAPGVGTLGSYRREDGLLLTSIDPGFVVERRLHGPYADGYRTIITWQSDAGGKDFRAIDHLEMSPTMQRLLKELL